MRDRHRRDVTGEVDGTEARAACLQIKPEKGLEPLTARLRIGSSTTELLRRDCAQQLTQLVWVTHLSREKTSGRRCWTPAGSERQSSALPPGLSHAAVERRLGARNARYRMPWPGFEPGRLAALPPQDSVSTSSTTRAGDER